MIFIHESSSLVDSISIVHCGINYISISFFKIADRHLHVIMNVVILNLEDVEKMKVTVMMIVNANLVLFVVLIIVTLVVSIQILIVVLET